MRSVENAEKMKKSLDIGNRPEKKNCPDYRQFIYKFFIPHSRFSNINAECEKRGVCYMEMNK